MSEASNFYRFKLLIYRARRRAFHHKCLLLTTACVLVTWIALNETFAVKLIFEQECFHWKSKSWKSCLSSTLERWSHALDNTQASKFYLNINSTCRKIRRVGHWQDGGWDVCVSDLPSSQEDCIVYSFGINDDPSFDVDLVKQWPHCTVYAFDPSIGRQTGDAFLGDHINFYNIGLGGHNYKNDRGWDMMDLESIMEMFRHKHVHILKMDVEYSEWQVLRNWRESNILGNIDQLLAELHFFTPSDFADNVASLQWLRQEGMNVFTRRENFRYSNLIDLPTADNKETVRTYSCLEVGWRRAGK